MEKHNPIKGSELSSKYNESLWSWTQLRDNIWPNIYSSSKSLWSAELSLVDHIPVSWTAFWYFSQITGFPWGDFHYQTSGGQEVFSLFSPIFAIIVPSIPCKILHNCFPSFMLMWFSNLQTVMSFHSTFVFSLLQLQGRDPLSSLQPYEKLGTKLNKYKDIWLSLYAWLCKPGRWNILNNWVVVQEGSNYQISIGNFVYIEVDPQKTVSPKGGLPAPVLLYLSQVSKAFI